MFPKSKKISLSGGEEPAKRGIGDIKGTGGNIRKFPPSPLTKDYFISLQILFVNSTGSSIGRPSIRRA